jgi:hypothetical protein
MTNHYGYMQQRLKAAGCTYDSDYVVRRHFDTLSARGLSDNDTWLKPGLRHLDVIARYVESYAKYRAAKVPEAEARLMAVSDAWRVAYDELLKMRENWND